MATENILGCITLEAGADLSAKQYTAVKVDSNGKAVGAGAADGAIGVIQDPAIQTEAVNVAVYGITRCYAGATVAAGAAVQTDATNRAITLAAGVKFGTALTGGAVGELISVLLKA